MNMLLRASVALLVLGLSLTAKAADMPVKYDPPKVFTWTGCYIGVAGGWIGVDRRYDRFASGESVDAAGPLALIVSETTVSTGANKSGGLVGGTVGCNWQSASSLVFGLEGDVSWLGNKVSFSEVFGAITNLTPRTETFSSETNWLATIRGRAGVVVANTLFYVTGGGAFANDKANFLLVTDTGSRFEGSHNETLIGLVAGVGLEWRALASYWSIKFEYLHAVMHDNGFTSPMTAFNGGGPIPAATWSSAINHTYDVVRVGLNYQFGAPVVARY